MNPIKDLPADSTADPPAPAPLTRARTLARVLDDLIPVPGTSWRVGLDPVLGLIPGVGDWVSWGMGLNLLWSAWQLGAGAGLLLRMSGNLLVDAALGAIPFLGDLFDFAWKANDRNLSLLEAHAADRVRTERASRWVLGGILGGTLAALSAAAWGAYLLLKAVWGLLP
ncbi:MAG TPA: DUF4112 domain-containing protein [Longimicrobiales bacterium]|nr:DUF4112 domain-containing protein [Longimicrobiales bacterium]